MVIRAAAGKEHDLMAALGETLGQLSEVLAARRDIRMEGLIKEEELQKRDTEVRCLVASPSIIIIFVSSRSRAASTSVVSSIPPTASSIDRCPPLRRPASAAVRRFAYVRWVGRKDWKSVRSSQRQ